MDENKVNQLIQQALARQASSSRFALNAIPRHVHNGTDSPFVLQPILTYVGSVLSNGGGTILPDGWTSSKIGTGNYSITHNLPVDAIFTVTATPVDLGTQVACAVSVNGGVITVSTYSTGTGGGQLSNSFHFLVTVVNNRSASIPTYRTFNPYV